MSLDLVSQRYAQSLFDLSKEQGKLEEVQVSLQGIGQLINNVPQLKEFLANPLLSIKEREQTLTAIFQGKVPDLVNKFLLFINHKNRLSFLAGIIDAFEQQYLAKNNQIKAQIQTALPLETIQREQILAQLSKKYGKNVVADWQIRKELLGGFRILIEGKLHDYSFTSQLEDYRQKVLQ